MGWSPGFGKLASVVFVLLLILFFTIMPERVSEYFLREIFEVRGYKKIIFVISWLILAGFFGILSLTIEVLFDELWDIGFDTIFESLHIG